jgi:hypothetical protein
LEGKERRYGLLSGRGVGYERLAAGYKRHGNGIIAQGAVWNVEDAIFCFLKGAGHSEAKKRPGRWA